MAEPRYSITEPTPPLVPMRQTMTRMTSLSVTPGGRSQSTVMAIFFSIRRRHTRCYRDWSSDVCSSDLEPHECASLLRPCQQRDSAQCLAKQPPRSEERRVGKECRSRWSTDHLKKNKKGRFWMRIGSQRWGYRICVSRSAELL